MTNALEPSDLTSRHLRFGWGSLLVFVLLGGVLEGMHGFKVDWYLAVGNETQRLMWRLAHAHGTFLSLVHVAFAFTVKRCSRQEQRTWRADCFVRQAEFAALVLGNDSACEEGAASLARSARPPKVPADSSAIFARIHARRISQKHLQVL